MDTVDESEKYLNEMRGDDFIRNEFLGGKLLAVADTFCGSVSDFSLMGVVVVMLYWRLCWRSAAGMLLPLLMRLCDLLWTSCGCSVCCALMGVDVPFVDVSPPGLIIMLLVVLLFDNVAIGGGGVLIRLLSD